MANSVNTNTSALSARRYLDSASIQLGRAQNQLSSGLKSPDPSDDPSGSAISSTLTSAISALTQAASNSVQASSLVQLATGTLRSTNDILTRLATLAAQANSDSIDDSARQMLDKEYQALVNQIDQNAKVSWGDVSLFTGGSGKTNGSSSGTTAGNVDSVVGMSGAIYGTGGSKASASGTNVSLIVGDQTFKLDLSSGAQIAPSTAFTLTSDRGDTITLLRGGGGNAYTQDAAGATSLANDLNAFFGSSAILANSGTGNGTVAQAAVGLQPVTNAFAGTMNANSTGFISGAVSGVDVVGNGAQYDITVTAGLQTFKATEAPSAGNQLVLTSTTDGNNKISLDYAASTGAITNANTFKVALQQLLGITGGSPASFTSTSTAMAKTQLLPGAATAPGNYALDYNVSGSTGTFKLSDGVNHYSANIHAAASISQDITFGNGMVLKLSAFDGSGKKAQATYNVDSGSAVNMLFQIGQKTSDVLNMSFRGMTAFNLGVSGTNITTKEQAGIANSAVLVAQKSVNNLVADLGGKKSQLDYLQSNLKVSIQNQLAAKATFSDADITDSLMNSQKYQAIVKMATTTFQKTLERDGDLARMVESVMR
jgi:flagellin